MNSRSTASSVITSIPTTNVLSPRQLQRRLLASHHLYLAELGQENNGRMARYGLIMETSGIRSYPIIENFVRTIQQPPSAKIARFERSTRCLSVINLVDYQAASRKTVSIVLHTSLRRTPVGQPLALLDMGLAPSRG